MQGSYLKSNWMQDIIPASKHAEAEGKQVKVLIQRRYHQQLTEILCQDKKFRVDLEYNSLE